MPTNTQFGHSSALIESLFPPGVAAAELRVPGDPSLLDPAEAAAVARAVPKRVQEFAAGRACARRAMQRFGVTEFILKAAPDRRPVWPEPLVGSITHTAGFCAAVVGERTRFLGLGVDTEPARAVKPELWSHICIGEELAWIDSLSGNERERAATLIFSAKEAFYKCQYPATKEWLNFSDLGITMLEWGAAAGSFEVAPTRPLAMFDRTSQPMRGAYRFHEEFVSAGFALTALESSISFVVAEDLDHRQ